MPVGSINTGQLGQFIDELSQLPSYTIGRLADNQIVLPSPKVSGHHARLLYCTPTSFLLEDLSSKHGSFVNDMRITRKIVGHTDTIRLAESSFTTQELLGFCIDRPGAGKPATPKATAIPRPETPANPLDFTRPFTALKQVYEQYPQLRKDCRNREKMIRTGSVILSSVVGISAVLSTGGGALPFIQIMSGAGLSVLIPTLSSTLLSTDEKLELIDKEYRERYRCPNPSCRDPFGARDWELLASQKTCRRCQAIWVN